MALQDPQGLSALRKDEAMQGHREPRLVTLIAMEKIRIGGNARE